MVLAESQNKNAEYLALHDRFVNPVLPEYCRIVAERASGSYIYDVNGDAYLDFSSAIATTNVGHCHPKVVAAIQKQAAELIHTSVATRHKPYIDLAQKLAEISPGNLDSVFLSNSGSEAIEGAVKLARYVTGRPAIINFRGSFHGRTLMATALTTSKLYHREGYEPLPGPIYTAKFPYMYRSAFRNDPQGCLSDAIHDLEAILHKSVHPKQVAAMIVEPIQGEGGFIVPPQGFLKKLREIADEYGILLIVDEVQTGFGRTGKMFACEHESVVPDILALAKGIASGMPLSAFIASRELTNRWTINRHGSTFGGNPVSCAASLATIDILEKEKLADRAARVGQEILAKLKAFAKDKPHIGEVRGKGLMIAIEFNDKNGEPGSDIAEQVINNCYIHKLIVLSCGSHGQGLRLSPPLNISDSEIEKGLDILCKGMTI